MADEQVQVQFENELLNGLSLNEGEEALLRQQTLGVLGANSSLLQSLFTDMYEDIKAAAAVAKLQFRSTFGGLFAADSEFGMQLIRAAHLMRTTATTETPNMDWSFTWTTAAATQNWIGFSTTNSTAINIDKRLTVLPLGVVWTQGNGPIVEELYPQVNGTNYPIQVIRSGWLSDNLQQVRFARLRPQVWRPKATVLVGSWARAAGVNELVVLGLSFAQGDLMRTQNISAVQT